MMIWAQERYILHMQVFSNVATYEWIHKAKTWRSICVTNNHDYVPFMVITIRSILLSFITCQLVCEKGNTAGVNSKAGTKRDIYSICRFSRMLLHMNEFTRPKLKSSLFRKVSFFTYSHYRHNEVINRDEVSVSQITTIMSHLW
jgi:hypothetical protein